MRKIFTLLSCLIATITALQAQLPELYILTERNGTTYDGTIARYTGGPSASLSQIKSFSGSTAQEGYSTNGGLTLASNGKLYGMTDEGGTMEYGVIFSFDPVTGTYSKLIDFGGGNGMYPIANNLVQAKNGKLYGTTPYGGTNRGGVLFSFDLTTNTYTKLKDFNYADGSFPQGRLTEASNGKLYGTTYQGGSFGYGIIYSFDPSNNTYTKVTNFDFDNGGQPYGDNGMIEASDGKLYGITVMGGKTGWGVVYSFDPSTSVYTKLKDLDNLSGNYSFGKLFQASDGLLYGTTYYGGSSDGGVIFSYNVSTRSYTIIKEFRGNDGIHPASSLMQASDGKLYGTTRYGGANDRGVVFSIDPSSHLFTKEKDFPATGPGSPLFGFFVELKTNLCAPDSSVTKETICPNQLPYKWNGQNYDKSGTYQVKLLSSRGCDSIATLNLTVSEMTKAPAVSVTEPSCSAPGSIKVTMPETGLSYSINGTDYINTTGIFDNLGAGTYTITTKNTQGCVSDATMVTLHQPQSQPPVPAVTSPVEYCQGVTPTPLKAVALPGNSLRWYTVATGGTASATVPTPLTGSPGQTSYYVSQVNSQGCEGPRAEIIVRVIALPVVNIKSSTTCTGTTTIVATPATGAANDYSLVWTVPVGVSAPGNVTSLNTITPGNYSVKIISKTSNCSSAPASLNLTTFVPLSANIPDAKVLDSGVNINTVYIGYKPGETITISAKVTGGTAPYSYTWSNGQSTASISVSPTAATIYKVTIKDSAGCQQTATKEIRIIDVRCDDKVKVCRKQGNSSFETDCMPPGAVADQIANGAYLGECKTGGRILAPGNTVQDAATTMNQLSVGVLPNPSTNYFTLVLKTTSHEPLQIAIKDQVGRLVETIRPANPSSSVKIGGGYRPGIYYAEVIQGNKRKVVTLLKQTR